MLIECVFVYVLYFYFYCILCSVDFCSKLCHLFSRVEDAIIGLEKEASGLVQRLALGNLLPNKALPGILQLAYILLNEFHVE